MRERPRNASYCVSVRLDCLADGRKRKESVVGGGGEVVERRRPIGQGRESAHRPRVLAKLRRRHRRHGRQSVGAAYPCMPAPRKHATAIAIENNGNVCVLCTSTVVCRTARPLCCTPRSDSHPARATPAFLSATRASRGEADLHFPGLSPKPYSAGSSRPSPPHSAQSEPGGVIAASAAPLEALLAQWRRS